MLKNVMLKRVTRGFATLAQTAGWMCLLAALFVGAGRVALAGGGENAKACAPKPPCPQSDGVCDKPESLCDSTDPKCKCHSSTLGCRCKR